MGRDGPQERSKSIEWVDAGGLRSLRMFSKGQVMGFPESVINVIGDYLSYNLIPIVVWITACVTIAFVVRTACKYMGLLVIVLCLVISENANAQARFEWVEEGESIRWFDAKRGIDEVFECNVNTYPWIMIGSQDYGIKGYCEDPTGYQVGSWVVSEKGVFDEGFEPYDFGECDATRGIYTLIGVILALSLLSAVRRKLFPVAALLLVCLPVYGEDLPYDQVRVREITDVEVFDNYAYLISECNAEFEDCCTSGIWQIPVQDEVIYYKQNVADPWEYWSTICGRCVTKEDLVVGNYGNGYFADSVAFYPSGCIQIDLAVFRSRLFMPNLDRECILDDRDGCAWWETRAPEFIAWYDPYYASGVNDLYCPGDQEDLPTALINNCGDYSAGKKGKVVTYGRAVIVVECHCNLPGGDCADPDEFSWVNSYGEIVLRVFTKQCVTSERELTDAQWYNEHGQSGTTCENDCEPCLEMEIETRDPTTTSFSGCGNESEVYEIRLVMSEMSDYSLDGFGYLRRELDTIKAMLEEEDEEGDVSSVGITSADWGDGWTGTNALDYVGNSGDGEGWLSGNLVSGVEDVANTNGIFGQIMGGQSFFDEDGARAPEMLKIKYNFRKMYQDMNPDLSVPVELKDITVDLAGFKKSMVELKLMTDDGEPPEGGDKFTIKWYDCLKSGVTAVAIILMLVSSVRWIAWGFAAEKVAS